MRPSGDVAREGGGAIDGPLRIELDRTLAIAGLANNALLHDADGQWEVRGDPTEGALIVAARKAGLEPGRLEARFARVGEVPFSSERKLMSTLHADAEHDGQVLLFTKGAPGVLLTRCSHELRGDATRPLDAARRTADSRDQHGACRPRAAHAGRRLPALSSPRSPLQTTWASTWSTTSCLPGWWGWTIRPAKKPVPPWRVRSRPGSGR